MRKTYGVGINDCDITRKYRSYQVDGKQKQELLWMCPYYSKWNGMLKRCYSAKYIEAHPTYQGCTVVDDWLLFSNFKNWCVEYCKKFNLNIKNVDLDKDILVKGNKIYEPDTCCLVDNSINKFLTYDKINKGDYPIGVSKTPDSSKLRARCKNPFTLKEVACGYFDTAEEAHEAWRKKKHEYACKLADSGYITDERIVKALKERFTYENWYKHSP